MLEPVNRGQEASTALAEVQYRKGCLATAEEYEKLIVVRTHKVGRSAKAQLSPWQAIFQGIGDEYSVLNWSLIRYAQ